MATGPGGKSIAFALSGGGHRATLFTLGALMYAVDAGRGRDTTSIASVSGGSITNGCVAQAVDFRDVSREAFERAVAGPLAARVAREGTLFAAWQTWAYLAALLLGFAGAVVVPWMLALPLPLRIVALVLLLAAWGWLLGQRGNICALAFRKTLFSPGGRASLLTVAARSLTHVFCATELRTAASVYFAGDFVYAFAFGPGRPGKLPLYRAVQASAAFPGGFPPSRLLFAEHEFAGPPGSPEVPRAVSQLILTDGGVYDNMGEEWARGFAARAKRWAWLAEHKPAPDQVVVVNASARRPWTPFRWGRIPLVGEIAAFLRVNDMMYVNTTTTRRQRLVDSWDPVEHTVGDGVPTALVQIAQTPYRVADAFARAAGTPVGQRAASVLGALGDDAKHRASWEDIATSNAAVATTLSALGTEVAARLLYQGYVVAMCNLHVLFGDEEAGHAWPLLAMPTLERFRRLAGG